MPSTPEGRSGRPPPPPPPERVRSDPYGPMRRRLAAVFALVVGAATLALAIAVAITEFPRGLVLLGCVLLAGVAAWYGLLRRGSRA